MSKKVITILPFVLAIIFLVSCGRKIPVEKEQSIQDNPDRVSDFVDMWRALPLPSGISIGNTWETDAFSIFMVNSEDGITVTYVSKDLSIEECFAEGYVFMNAVAYPCDYFLFDSETFYMMALLEDISADSASVTIHHPSDTEAIMLILIIDGEIYNELFFLQ